VVLRLSNLDHVAPEPDRPKSNRVLKQELSTTWNGGAKLSLGGVQPVAEMLNVMDKNTETAIHVAPSRRKTRSSAEEIRKPHVRVRRYYEDRRQGHSNHAQRGFRTTSSSSPSKTANEEIRTKIFKNISQRAAKLLQEDLGNMGPARLSPTWRALRSEIVNIARRRLEQEGQNLPYRSRWFRGRACIIMRAA